jgi:tRNA-2-methylthio-N6-dimethylallyladenosine synthase
MRIADALIENGNTQSDTMDNADVLIFNTCSIREKADEKLFSDLGRAKSLKLQAKDRGIDIIIIVAGCVAQAKSEEILKRAPYVDAIVGPQNIQHIASLVKNISQKKEENSKILIDLDTKDKFLQLTSKFFNRGCSEFITIQEGCDNFCTYCVVPYTRGREVSRDVSDILSEAKSLISIGVKEITLLGQNVNSYKGIGIDGKTWDFSRLIFAISELKNLKRLRYITSNPKDVNEDIAKAHGEIDILIPFLHLPAQSGSDEILKKMNRKYTADEYLKCIDMFRKYRPDMAFSSDFIVGFPGETDLDFQKTMDMVEAIRFSQAYSFKFSPRNGTVAAKMENHVSEEVKSQRLRILQDTLNNQQTQFNIDSLGKTLKVLFVKKGIHRGQLIGRSEYSHAVSVCDSCIKIGDIVNVNISDVKSHSLVGTIDK